MRWLTWKFLDRFQDYGLLVLRVGLGLSMIVHGVPKLAGGPEKWESLGGAMGALGITFLPTMWGFLAAVSEAVGGALLALGLGTRPAAAALAFTMFVAMMMHIQNGDGFRGYSHAMEDMIAFVAVLLMGGGRFSVDARLKG